MTMYQLYSQYERKYANAERDVKRVGREGMYSTKYSREEFELQLEAHINTYGGKASDYIDNIVSRQKYPISYKQAQAYQKAMKIALGKDMTLDEIFRDAEFVKGEIDSATTLMDEQLKADGFSEKGDGNTRAELIGQAIFGSP